MWIPSQSAQAGKPPCRPNGPSQLMLVTPDEAPDDRDVAVVAVAERLVRPAEDPPADDLAPRTAPPCIAPWATPGVGWSGFHGSTAASPTTKISGWPGIVRSGSTMTRPARSVVAPVASATVRAKLAVSDARRPEDGPGRDRLLGRRQARRRGRRPRPGRRPSSPSGPSHRASRAGAGPTPTDRADRAAGRDPSPRSGSTRVWSERIDRKSRLSVSWAISPSAPASSTPVGPPPTSTNVIHARRRSGSASRSAASKAIRIRRRISSRVLDRLQPGRDGRPFGVVEIGVVGAGRDDERVVGDRSAVGEEDLALVGVDARPPRRG